MRNSGSVALMLAQYAGHGGCATLLNGWWTGDELSGGIELAGCKLVLADAQRAEATQQAIREDPFDRLTHHAVQHGLLPTTAYAVRTATTPHCPSVVKEGLSKQKQFDVITRSNEFAEPGARVAVPQEGACVMLTDIDGGALEEAEQIGRAHV